MTADEEEFQDFDALMPKKRTAKIGGKTFDLTIIPAGAHIRIARRLKGKSLNLEDMEGRIETVALILESQGVTKEWLMAAADLETVSKFCMYVIEPLARKGKELRGSDEPKNPRKPGSPGKKH